MELTIYEKIRQRRIELGMSQDELARLVGYTSRSSINKIEAGKVDISRSKIVAFANALQLNPSELMGWEEEQEMYYHDPKVNEMAERLRTSGNTRILFDATRDMSEDDIEFVVKLIEKLKKND